MIARIVAAACVVVATGCYAAGSGGAARTLHEHRVAYEAAGGRLLSGSETNDVAVSGTLSYFLTDRLGIGVSGRFYYGGSSTGLPVSAWPQRATQFSSDLEFENVLLQADPMRPVVPDVYALAGIGMISIKPVAVVDPERTFDSTLRVAPVLGVGARWFLTPSIAASVEMRDSIFDTVEENPQIATNRAEPMTWTASSTDLVNDFELDLGLTVFLPFAGGAP